MRKGFLSQYFEDIAVKKLSTVEVDTSRSNQHEFHGTVPLRNLFGGGRLNNYPVTFVWLGGNNEGVSEEGLVTWYDSRENQPFRSAEWRLYFKRYPIMDLALTNDLLIVARRANEEIYIIVIQQDSTFENQVLWLFNLENIKSKFRLPIY